ncbi:flagellar motor switch protein FliG [Arcobacter sp. 15-2]|uniref:flagellar motor switch protein FliG n=1 Tax=Arcobacter sp. 15-2 TaxID=3374109 RepID=UPI00399CF2AC
MIKETTKNTIEGMPMIERVAHFCVLIGEEATVKIFQSLPNEVVEDLSIAITQIRSIDKETSLGILEEFHLYIQSSSYISSGGFDYAKDILYKSLGKAEADKVLAKLARLQEAKQAFSYLDNIDPKQLADFIKDESPQTIAVVLAHMDAEDASMVLSKLDDTLKVKISMQMATIKDVSPSIVQSMSKVLEKKLESLLASIVTVGGVKTVADMLNKMGSKSTEILENIQGLDPQLAAKIKENMFVFEDLLALDTNDIMKVLGNIETEDLTIALKNATEEDMAIIMGSMSQRARDRFKEEFEMLGRTKIKDIEDAQRKILDVAMQLLESGEIERIDEE